MTTVQPTASTATPNPSDQRVAGAWPVSLQTLAARLSVLETAVRHLQDSDLEPGLRGRGPKAIQAAIDATHRDLGVLTEAQRTLAYNESCGWHETAPIATPSHGLDPGDDYDVPLLAAKIAVTGWKNLPPIQVNGRYVPGGQVDGRFTEVWVDHGTSTAPLTPAKAREIAGEIANFAARLEALATAAERIARDDYQADQPERRS